MEIVQAHVFITGFVQGVGFRRYLRHKARKFGAVGWTQNLPDGRVEAVFQGKKEIVHQMIGFAKRGPFLSDVKTTVIEWEKPAETFTEFVICW
jgi:acylphosphatase